MSVRAFPSDCIFSLVCVANVSMCSERVCAPRRRAVSIARPALRVGGRARVVAFGATGRARARSAAGITWTSRTLKAPWWGARSDHTSVIDATGAIYVIGGQGTFAIYFSDVWVSTDGGARPDLVKGWSWGTRGGTQVGTGYYRVLRGSIRVLRSTQGLLHGYSRGT